MSESQNRLDEFLKALTNTYRREFLFELSNHDPKTDVEPDPLHIDDFQTFGESRYDIFIDHLPTLDNQEIIAWDKETNEIMKGPDWDEFAPLLGLIADHKHELPSEWFVSPDKDRSTTAHPQSETKLPSWLAGLRLKYAQNYPNSQS